MQAFNLTTPDGEILYAWHILPVALYSKNQKTLLLEPLGLASDAANSRAARLLRDDPESRLVITCKSYFSYLLCQESKARQFMEMQGAFLRGGVPIHIER